MKHLITIVLSGLVLLSCQQKTKVNDPVVNYLDEGSIEVLDQEIKLVLNPQNKLEILSEEHDWTEGPLWLEDQQMLLFSDIPRNTVYSWDTKNGTKEYLKPSGFTGGHFEGSEPGANGLLLDPEGHLILCQHGNRQVAQMNSPLDQPVSDFSVVADTFEGKRLNSPNDAVFDSGRNLYFTDPPYGLPEQMEDAEKELNYQGVYKLTVSGDLILIDSTLSRPNGIAFSPDEKVLYVANSDPEKAIWMAYEMDEMANIVSKKKFFDVTALVKNEKGLPDGLKVNREGYLFATGPGGVFVFSPSGKHLGTIRTGQATSNVAFNANETVLFMTADSYLLKLDLK